MTNQNPSPGKRAKYAAETAVGTTMATAVPAGYRLENKARGAVAHHYDRKMQPLKAQQSQLRLRPAPIEVKVPTKSGRTVRAYRAARTPAEKATRSQQLKHVTGQLNHLAHRRNEVLKPKIFNHQKNAWLTGIGIGLPLAWHGARNQVQKSVRRRDVDATIAGGVLAAGGSQAASRSLTPFDRAAERKITESKDLTAIHRAHKNAHLTGGKIVAGNPENIKYFRTYPKSLPGWRMKRGLAYTHAGRSGTALAVATGLAGGAAGYKLNRKIQKESPMNEINKAGSDKGHRYSTGRAASATAFGAYHSAVAGKKGKKLRATGRSTVETALGGLGGGALAGAVTRGRAPAVARFAGPTGGAVGAYHAFRSNNRKGYYKKQDFGKSSSVSAFGVDHGV